MKTLKRVRKYGRIVVNGVRTVRSNLILWIAKDEIKQASWKAYVRGYNRARNTERSKK